MHIAYSTLPRLNRSARWSSASPRACSGAMYGGVPVTTPVCVTLASSIARASEKSVSLTRSTPFSSRMLAGLTSRWISPWAWAAAKPAAVCMPIRSDLRDRQRAAVSASRCCTRRPGDVLHHQVRQALELLDGVDGDDVLVPDRGGGPGLAREPLAGRAADRQLRGQHLDRDDAMQPGIERLEHDAHAAAADFLQHLVVIDAAERARPCRTGRGNRAAARPRRIGVRIGIDLEAGRSRRAVPIARSDPIRRASER